MSDEQSKGDTMTINGDTWTVVDAAPAAPLAEMVAALLEEEGFVAITRGPDLIGDVLGSLGGDSLGITYVLVPEAQAEAALALIAETVTDFEGEELETMLASMTEEEKRAFFGEGIEDEDEDED